MNDITDDPVHDADVYYLVQEHKADAWDRLFEELYANPENFSTFIYDTDFSDPNWFKVHTALVRGTGYEVNAVQAIQEMYEDHIEHLTNEMFEDMY